MLDVTSFVAAMTSEDSIVPPFGLNSSLRIDRADLVSKTIKIAEGRDQQVYIRGAAGTGKTVLLELIAMKLAQEGKRAVVIRHAGDFESCWSDIKNLADNGPLYVLVDDVHHTVKDSIWSYLRTGAKRPFITIGAGIPDEARASVLFLHHIEVREMLLESAELQRESLVQFYASLLEKSCENIEREVSKEECTTAVKDVLSFTHEFTSGHIFPCLKMVEYFVTDCCAECLAADVRGELQRAIASPQFATVFDAIFKRCYSSIGFETFDRLAAAWWTEPGGARAVWTELARLGLWLTGENCLISLLLQYTIMNKFGPSARAAFDVNYENFGALLVHALKYLGEAQFQQFSSETPEQRERCEDGIGLFIGARLSNVEGVYLSPQHALPRPGRRRGRPPSVDYYINHTLDMFLQLTRNGSLLKEHCESFLETGPYHGKRFVVLDLELRDTEIPAPLPATVAMFEPCRYTYVVKRNALYRGTELFHHPVRVSDI